MNPLQTAMMKRKHQTFERVRRPLALLAFMREKKGREGRAFDENDHAICVALTLFAPRPKDGRPAKRKPRHLLVGLAFRYAQRQERSDSRDIFRLER
jgi:hypothetical protein